MNNALVRRLAELERRHAPPARRETLEELLAQSRADLIAAFGEDDFLIATAGDDDVSLGSGPSPDGVS